MDFWSLRFGSHEDELSLCMFNLKNLLANLVYYPDDMLPIMVTFTVGAFISLTCNVLKQRTAWVEAPETIKQRTAWVEYHRPSNREQTEWKRQRPSSREQHEWKHQRLSSRAQPEWEPQRPSSREQPEWEPQRPSSRAHPKWKHQIYIIYIIVHVEDQSLPFYIGLQICFVKEFIFPHWSEYLQG